MTGHLHETHALSYWRSLAEEIDALDGAPIGFDEAYTHYEAKTPPHLAAHQIVGSQELKRMLSGSALNEEYGKTARLHRATCSFCANPADDPADVRRAMEG